jgi:ABC-type nitrate/sulfonate/bicarbonate transport system permease component
MKKILFRIIPTTILIIIWEYCSYCGFIPKYKLPSPFEVFTGFKDLILIGLPPEYRLPTHILYSLWRVFSGYITAIIIAIPLGIFLGWLSWLRQIINPLLEIIRPIPPLAWAPLAIMWFGIGIKSATFIIFLGAFFPILLNTTAGVTAANSILIDAAKTLNATQWDILVKILIPSAIPNIFIGLRIAIGISWMTLVAAEFVSVESGYGLGYMIMSARDVQRIDEIIAGMLIIGWIGLLTSSLLYTIESYVIKWK